jgi:hypothetical protein
MATSSVRGCAHAAKISLLDTASELSRGEIGGGKTDETQTVVFAKVN